MTAVQIDADTQGGDADVRADPAMGTLALPGRDALDRETLAALSAKSDRKGLLRLAGHAGVIALGIAAVYAAGDNLWLQLPAMLALGFAWTTLFAPMHECVHATPFASRRLNRLVGWFAGAAIGLNVTYYRRFHAWHHRYTQDPDNDPELRTPKPASFWQYLKRLSGLPYYVGLAAILWRCAMGRIVDEPWIPARGVGEIQRSVWMQLGLYGAVGLIAVAFGSWAPLTYWLIPMLLAQPLMRWILLAEHTGCSEDRNGLTNTRTTLAAWPVRFLMWNMPYHAEHHLYPSVPYHALPKAHRLIKERVAHVSDGYAAAHRDIRQEIAAGDRAERAAV